MKARAQWATVLALVTVLACLGTAISTAAPERQSANLLQNPSFEQGVTGGWQWWSYQKVVMKEGTKEPDLNLSYYAPYFQASGPDWDEESGGTAGAAGELAGLPWRKFRAGFYQSVEAAAGSRVRFGVWANGYCVADDGHTCPVLVKAGIDPTGGIDWASYTVSEFSTINVRGNGLL